MRVHVSRECTEAVSRRCPFHAGPYIEMEAFTPAQVQKASKACTAMCMWVRAMHKYHQVSVMVEPKKKLLAEEA